MKITTSKVLTVLLILALLLSGGFLGKLGLTNMDLEDANEALNKELMEADLEKGRALTQYGKARDYIDQLEVDIQDEVKQREATVTMYGELQARYKVLERKLKAKTTVTTDPTITIQLTLPDKDNPGETSIPEGIFPGGIYIVTNDFKLSPIVELKGEYSDQRIRILTSLRSNSEPGKDPVFYHDYQLNMAFRLKIIESHTRSGAVNHYATLYEVDSKGKDIQKLEIEDFKVIVDKPSDRQWYWWAPHLDIGALAAVDLSPNVQLGGSLGVSFMGWGRTENDLTIRVARLSLDITDMPGFGFTPFQYNLGEPIPLLSNLWIGPHITYSSRSEWQFGLLLSAML